METAISRARIGELVVHQIESNFLLEPGEVEVIENFLKTAFQRTEYCFSFQQDDKYYWKESKVFFNPYHSAQYCAFLYYLSNSIWQKEGPIIVCDKIYCLNKMLNAIDLFYEVVMPAVFYTDHPVGTVLGRAKYGNRFCFTQNCTVGNNKGVFPEIGENVKMYSGARILGASRIGSGSIIASGTFVKDQDVPGLSVVFGSSPNLIIKPLEGSGLAK
jgi:serine O-acetyltransferase